MNPILQAMMGGTGNKAMNSISMLQDFVKGDPQAAYNALMQKNPQFRAFCEKNKGKSVDQIAKEYGIDMALVRQFLK